MSNSSELDRNRLAQLASEEMIKELVTPSSIKRFSNFELNDFLENITRLGTGLYVVGLDTHTGFIHCQNSDIRFIHASGRFPFAVINERARESIILGKSKYRIIGKLTNDDKFMGNWLRK